MSDTAADQLRRVLLLVPKLEHWVDSHVMGS